MIAVVATFGCAMAQSRPDIVSIRDARLPLWQTRDAVCASSPATMVRLDSISLSAIGVSVHYDRQSAAVMQQLGNGGHDFTVGAESYTRLSPSSCVWGSAGFRTGVTRDVRWTDCIDYMRVAPYVLGDAVGGDMSSREYTFSGGYAKDFGRWIVGAEAAYRAEIAYRDRDPRIKTVVSDLAVGLGASYAVSQRYVLGLDAAVDIYRQNCDLDFYNPVNDINTYPLTGLGTYYKRFTGNANKNSGYQSDGYSAGLQLVSADGYGFNSSVGITRSHMEQRLRNYNNLTLGMTDLNNIDFTLTYVCRLSYLLRFAPSIDFSSESLKGIENLFGTSSGGSYDIIGKRSNYRQTHRAVSVTLPLEVTAGTNVLTASPRMAWSDVSARVIDIDRKFNVTGWTPGISVDYSTVTASSMLVEAAASVDYTFSSAPAAKNNILAQTPNIEIASLGECLASNFGNLQANRLGIGLDARVGKMINQILYSVKFNYRYLSLDTGIRCHTVALTLGATF